MRLANGIIIDKEKTFGVLKFSALRREVHIQNEDGTVSEEIKERTYDLKCKEQGRMIQVSIPASVPLKEFDYNAEVEIINPVADTVATATFQGADVDWYIKADDIVLKNKHSVSNTMTNPSQTVQKFISVKKRPNKTGRPNMFVGLVKCPDCGRNMAFSNPNGREPRFRCRTYARNSNLCTTHAISYDALVKIVMDDIQKHIKNMETLGDQFIEEMRVLSESGGGKKIKQFKQELELAEKRIAEIDSIIMKLFEQNVAGKISDGRFEKMSVTYENEQRELEERRKALKEKIEAEDYKTKNTNQFLETIRKYENVTELNRSMLVELIDSIYVYQAEGTGKERTQKVEINYRFLCESQCGIA